MKTRTRAALIIAAVISAHATAAADPLQYTVELFGSGVVINDMNESGEVVGWTLDGDVQAFVAGPDHTHELLPLPTGYASAWAQGINDAGVIVGSVAVGSFPEFGQAVSWTLDGRGGYGIDFLGQLPGHTQSVAFDINNRGDIIGFSIMPGFQGGPTVWFNSPSDVMNIGELGAPSSPKEINDEGVIVGINGGLFDIDTMETMPLPPFTGNMTAFQGWAINNHNELAGTAFHGGFVLRSASNWTKSNGWQALGGLFDASAQIYAFDINDDGTTVMQTPQAAAYLQGKGTFSLSSLVVDEQQGDWLFLVNQGAAVNNAGQIANIVTHQPSGQTGVGIMTPVMDTLPGDLDGSGSIDVSDLLMLLAAWGECTESLCPADLDESGSVDVFDLLIMLANWQ